jgi:hypothetical protein
MKNQREHRDRLLLLRAPILWHVANSATQLNEFVVTNICRCPLIARAMMLGHAEAHSK